MSMKDFVFTPELNSRIFAHFEGMDTEYEKLIRAYHTVFLTESYTQEHKNKERGLTIDRVRNLKKDRVDKAKGEIEKIKQEYTEAPEPVKYTPEERTANLLLWAKILPTATIEEMQELWGDNSTNNDLQKLLVAELRERGGDSPTPKINAFLHQLQHGVADTRFRELDKLAQGFNLWASGGALPGND